MTAFALHLPERPGVARWGVAAAVIAALHVAIFVAALFWIERSPSTPQILPAIAVTLAPVQSSSPEIQDQDIAVGPTMQQAEETPPERPKVEDKPVERVEPPPSPPREAEVTLPKDKPKQQEQPKPEPQPPAPETRALPKNDRVGQFSEAGAKAYNSLILGHLQRFKRYPKSAHGILGKVVVRFVLNRAGDVIDSTITKSSGNTVLDREALDMLHRASPFPPFPVEKPGGQDIYIAPVNFDRD
jgi:protein TonB